MPSIRRPRPATVATTRRSTSSWWRRASTALSLEEIAAFLGRVPSHVCVILDEAYCEFSLAIGDPHASVDLLRRFPNLVLLRTFSKVYGLAGMRVGYALCGTDTFRTAVDQVRQPFYLGMASQAAAVEALRHQDEVERRVVATVAGRGRLMDGLRELDLWVAESDANFIWVRVGDASASAPDPASAEAAIVAGLRERGVLVRAGAALGEAGCLRVTVGTDAENEKFIAALGALLAT